jgi:hypothetical protein
MTKGAYVLFTSTLTRLSFSFISVLPGLSPTRTHWHSHDHWQAAPHGLVLLLPAALPELLSEPPHTALRELLACLVELSASKAHFSARGLSDAIFCFMSRLCLSPTPTHSPLMCSSSQRVVAVRKVFLTHTLSLPTHSGPTQTTRV